MKSDLIVLIVVSILSFTGCKNERKYIYPRGEQIELQRVCGLIRDRGTNRFMILLGKIYPLNNDGFTFPLKNVSTSLADAGYFCGRNRLKNDYCSELKSEDHYKIDC